MPRIPLPIVGGSYETEATEWDGQRTRNWIPVAHETIGGRAPITLIETPGLAHLATLGHGPVRALKEIDGYVYAISGNGCYRVAEDGSFTLLGLTTNATGPASIAWNGFDLFFADGHGISTWTKASATWNGRIAGSVRSSSVDFIDNRIIAVEEGSGRLWWTGLASSTIDGLSFATAEYAPDNLQGVAVLNGELFAFGVETTEVWTDTGALDATFQRLAGGLIEKGCHAPSSIVKMDNSVCWLASDNRGPPYVARIAGYNEQRISTRAVEKALIDSGRLEDATAWAYRAAGGTFYCITAPGMESTWCHDVASGLWHERSWRNTATGRDERHRANTACAAWEGVVVGDWDTGALYDMASEYRTDGDAPIVRTRRAQYLDGGGEWHTASELEVKMQCGVGQSFGDLSDPQLMMRYSDDGGHNWSPVRTAPMGRTGAYSTRVRFRRLGRFRDRIFELSVSDAVPARIIGAWLQFD